MPETSAQYATGKRKTAIARIWLSAGDGTIVVNGKPVDEYFERATARMVVRQSLEVLELLDKYSARATVTGGGHSAQAEAMRHGIARALIAEDPERRRSGTPSASRMAVTVIPLASSR
jgi:small subunit ribosomal protein S9